VAEELATPELLIANAGVTQPKRFEAIEVVDYDRIFEVNLHGALICAQEMLPYLRRLGRGGMIFMSSNVGRDGGGIFGGPHYAASKEALLGLTRALARELAPEGIRVNAVAPGPIDTDIRGDLMPPERLAQVVARIPLGRLGKAEEVAGACLFLASDLAGFVTGEVLDVNGGLFID
jgi:NAD(P)-dependent dehydrogenase (short-subunit alcohol dehydrogenase family)